ncbi:hypothetical protein DPMN_046265 [Dreissena polymorpha]|uniref:Uncharacterized protein n=1 Tax=Dreissena polymorpha TaxID=45954 RepID=A0A9D4D838_DREPO|nr:hypothetical protein DPMN_046265 [Dreissena polymorpha]
MNKLVLVLLLVGCVALLTLLPQVATGLQETKAECFCVSRPCESYERNRGPCQYGSLCCSGSTKKKS